MYLAGQMPSLKRGIKPFTGGEQNLDHYYACLCTCRHGHIECPGRLRCMNHTVGHGRQETPSNTEGFQLNDKRKML